MSAVKNQPKPIFWVVGACLGFSFASAVASGPTVLKPVNTIQDVGLAPRKLSTFDPPTPYQRIEAAQAAVTISNASPDPLNIEVINTTGERMLLTFPPCPTCPVYAPGTMPPDDCQGAPVPQTYMLSPGSYQAKARFLGTTRGFSSEWTVSSGWEYRQCVFSTSDLTATY